MRSPEPVADVGPYLETAKGVAQWLVATARPTAHGCLWPQPESEGDSWPHNLFHGNAGIAAFLLEHYAATGDDAALRTAVAASDELLTAVASEAQVGLYAGLAGVGYALLEAWAATGEPRFADGVRRCVERLEATALPHGSGVRWATLSLVQPGETAHPTDLVFGNAGIGLFLLDAAARLAEPAWLQLAEAAGRTLLDVADRSERGFDWAMEESYPRRMPNFSHGTAGIVYFLASLHLATGQDAFADAAVRGGEFLRDIAWTDGDVAFIQHNDPPAAGVHDDPAISYLTTWSHGPIGTGWAFYRLFQITQDDSWLDWLLRCGRALLPERAPAAIADRIGRTRNSYTWLAGPPAEANFFLDLHRVTGDPQWLSRARELMDDTLAQVYTDTTGTRWSRPDVDGIEATPYAGLMAGPAGVGLLLLYLHGFLSGRPAKVVLPDHPFPQLA